MKRILHVGVEKGEASVVGVGLCCSVHRHHKSSQIWHRGGPVQGVPCLCALTAGVGSSPSPHHSEQMFHYSSHICGMNLSHFASLCRLFFATRKNLSFGLNRPLEGALPRTVRSFSSIFMALTLKTSAPEAVFINCFCSLLKNRSLWWIWDV